MNLLFVIGRYSSFGGTERITTVLANALDGKCAIAACRGRCDPLKFGLADKVKCFELDKNPIMVLRNILRSEKIDVVINQWCLPFWITWMINIARMGLNVKLISVLHGVPDRTKRIIVAENVVNNSVGILKIIARLRLFIYDLVIKWSIRGVYRGSDAYVVLSNGFVSSFQGYTGLKDVSKLFVIGNPIAIKTDYKHVDVKSKKKQILYVGRMDKENKRVDRIIKVWEEIASDFQDWNLLLVGGGPDISEFRNYVDSNHIERVTFTGFLNEDPIKQYQESAVFMLTSELEGFGLAVLEAMSYGVVPLVYGGYATIYDIIDDGVNGLITPMPYSNSVTKEKLRMLLSDEHLRYKMGCKAVEKAMCFSLEETLSKWLCLLNNIVNK